MIHFTDTARRDRRRVAVLPARRSHAPSLYKDPQTRRSLTAEFATEQVLQDFRQSLMDRLSDARPRRYHPFVEAHERRATAFVFMGCRTDSRPTRRLLYLTH